MQVITYPQSKLRRSASKTRLSKFGTSAWKQAFKNGQTSRQSGQKTFDSEKKNLGGGAKGEKRKIERQEKEVNMGRSEKEVKTDKAKKSTNQKIFHLHVVVCLEVV